jgi:hypothetical protein
VLQRCTTHHVPGTLQAFPGSPPTVPCQKRVWPDPGISRCTLYPIWSLSPSAAATSDAHADVAIYHASHAPVTYYVGQQVVAKTSLLRAALVHLGIPHTGRHAWVIPLYHFQCGFFHRTHLESRSLSQYWVSLSRFQQSIARPSKAATG